MYPHYKSPNTHTHTHPSQKMSKEKWPLACIKHTCYNHHVRHGPFVSWETHTHIHKHTKQLKKLFPSSRKISIFFPSFTPSSSTPKKTPRYYNTPSLHIPTHTHPPSTIPFMQNWSYVCAILSSSFFFLNVRCGWTDDDGLVIFLRVSVAHMCVCVVCVRAGLHL